MYFRSLVAKIKWKCRLVCVEGIVPPPAPLLGLLGKNLEKQTWGVARDPTVPRFAPGYPPLPEAVKKLNDLGSPCPNEGEGPGVRGGEAAAHTALSPEEALQMRKDKRTLSEYGNPPHPQPLGL
jgi:hypothetical protein